MLSDEFLKGERERELGVSERESEKGERWKREKEKTIEGTPSLLYRFLFSTFRLDLDRNNKPHHRAGKRRRRGPRGARRDTYTKTSMPNQ